jgi:hypothetical protein
MKSCLPGLTRLAAARGTSINSTGRHRCCGCGSTSPSPSPSASVLDGASRTNMPAMGAPRLTPAPALLNTFTTRHPSAADGETQPATKPASRHSARPGQATLAQCGGRSTRSAPRYTRRMVTRCPAADDHIDLILVLGCLIVGAPGRYRVGPNAEVRHPEPLCPVIGTLVRRSEPGRIFDDLHAVPPVADACACHRAP